MPRADRPTPSTSRFRRGQRVRISDRSKIAANRGLEGTVVFTWRSVTMRQWCSVEIVPNGELSVPAHELDLLPTA